MFHITRNFQVTSVFSSWFVCFFQKFMGHCSLQPCAEPGKNPLLLKQPLIPDSVLQPRLQRAIYLPWKVTLKTDEFYKKRRNGHSFLCSLYSFRGLRKQLKWSLVNVGVRKGGTVFRTGSTLLILQPRAWLNFWGWARQMCLLQHAQQRRVSPPAHDHTVTSLRTPAVTLGRCLLLVLQEKETGRNF